MASEALHVRNANSHRLVAARARASGEVQKLSDGRAAVVDGLNAVAVNDTHDQVTRAIKAFVSASAVTFSKGDQAYWDVANNTAVTLANAAAGDIYLGRVHKAKVSGDLVVEVDMNALGEAHCRGEGKLYAQVAASAAVTNTTTETNFDKTYSIPANKLKAGDVLWIRAQVIATATNATDTLTLRIKLGSTTIVATAAVDVADNDIGVLDVFVLFRTVGASGTMVAMGFVSLGVPGTATARPVSLASTDVDTTAAIVAAVSAAWSVASAGNSCRLDCLAVTRMSDRIVL